MKLVCGVAVNDADYRVSEYQIVNGIKRLVWKCPYYRKWQDMLMRCNSDKHQSKFPSYKGVRVCEEWLTFSNFREWMEKQDWKGKELDKDLIGDGSLYSPGTCLFITKGINLFISHNRAHSELPTGVHYHIGDKCFHSSIRNPFTKKQEFLGMFSSSEVAHKAWKKRKSELAIMLANTIEDEVISKALISKYEY